MVSLHDSFYEGYVSYGIELGKELGRVEGYSKGAYDSRIATMADVATSLIDKLDTTLEQAIDLLDVPSDIRDEVRQKAEQLLKERD